MPSLLNRALGLLKPHRPDYLPFSEGETLPSFAIRMAGAHQAGVALIAIAVAILNFAPVDLQRRIIDGPIAERNVGGLLLLGGIYAAAVLLQSALKYFLQVYQSWLSESAVKRSRDRLAEIADEEREAAGRAGGQTVNVIGPEIERVGAFIGESISQAVVNVTFLLVIVAYMFAVEPLIALVSLLLLLPQIVVTPYMQRELNRLVERQLGLVRQLGDEVSGSDDASGGERQTIFSIYRNRIRFFILKYGLKTLLNVVNAMGPLVVLLVGGWMAIAGQTTIGVVVAFISGFERMSTPIRDLATFYRAAAQARVQHQMIATWVGTRTRDAAAEPANSFVSGSGSG
jgi:ABC-type bacteriocin/lantibiotic exporter with double-glycine peptidase domain